MVIQQYREKLEREARASSTINLQLAALRKLASGAAENGLLENETVSTQRQVAHKAETAHQTEAALDLRFGCRRPVIPQLLANLCPVPG
jgi:hypothetical protein